MALGRPAFRGGNDTIECAYVTMSMDQCKSPLPVWPGHEAPSCGLDTHWMHLSRARTIGKCLSQAGRPDI